METGSFSTSSAEFRRAHAEHNGAVCDYLSQVDEFDDWVVTTAFYAALHWMRSHLFPRTVPATDGESRESIANFEAYRTWHGSTLGRRTSPHQLLLELSRSDCPGEIFSAYKSLHDQCMAARYVDYRTKKKTSVKARRSLERIRDFCQAGQDAA